MTKGATATVLHLKTHEVTQKSGQRNQMRKVIYKENKTKEIPLSTL